MSTITIIDYGMGNLLSVQNMIRKVGGEATIESDTSKIQEAESIILPGVGHFGKAMELIQNMGLIEVLNRHVFELQKPILGICLGMQLLFEKSEEGNSKGLGFIKGEIKKFDSNLGNLKIPHMGWNSVIPTAESKLFSNIAEEQRFYFVHSYFAQCQADADVAGRTTYGINFCSAVQNNNICGVQFHPEKSHKFGMRLFENYLKNTK
jgi:glutamine amidotransferase